MSDEQIRVEQVKTCLFCAQPGTKLYEGLHDRLFHIPGVWGFLLCSRCGLAWLHPRPTSEGMRRTNAVYLTDDDNLACVRLHRLRKQFRQAVLATAFGYRELLPGPGWRWAGRVAGLVAPLREMVGLSVMGLERSKCCTLLDVGCGSGRFLAEMRGLGWEVQGVEPDAKAAEVARQRHGLRVITGTLEEVGMSVGSVDVVTMSHVIEHVPDPIGSLKQCRRLLRPGGKLVLLTPNLESLGHRVFKGFWRGLEPPRHLHLFSLRTLRTCAERAGLGVEVLRTTARCARWFWWASCMLRANGKLRSLGAHWWIKAGGLAFHAVEEAARQVARGAGEELVLIATKDGENSAGISEN